MAFTLTLAVLLSLTGCVDLITVSSPQRRVNVTVGGTVHLQCVFITSSKETNNLIIQWTFDKTESTADPQQIYYYQSGEAVIPKPYLDRIKAPSPHNTSGNASISISNMQASDSGLYTCEVRNFPDIDGKSEANIVVNVLERPSAPFCAVHGDVAVGHLVTLTCHSEKGRPAPTYSWVRLDQAKASQRVMGRVTPTGILEIRNISEFKFGEYLCNSSNSAGSSTCTVELSAEAEDGVIAGAVIGALLGCLLVVLVVWFSVHQLKKHGYTTVKPLAAAAASKGTSRPPPPTSDVSMEMSSPSHNSHGDDDEARA